MGGRHAEKGFVRLGGSAVAEDTTGSSMWPASLLKKGTQGEECSNVNKNKIVSNCKGFLVCLPPFFIVMLVR
jgi:hypothetical protein